MPARIPASWLWWAAVSFLMAPGLLLRAPLRHPFRTCFLAHLLCQTFGRTAARRASFRRDRLGLLARRLRQNSRYPSWERALCWILAGPWASWDKGTRFAALALTTVRHCRCHRHCPGDRVIGRQVTVFGPRSTKPLRQNIIASAYTLSLAQSVYPSLERWSSRVCPDASCRVGRYQNQSHQIRQYGTRSDYSRQPELDAAYRSADLEAFYTASCTRQSYNNPSFLVAPCAAPSTASCLIFRWRSLFYRKRNRHRARTWAPVVSSAWIPLLSSDSPRSIVLRRFDPQSCTRHWWTNAAVAPTLRITDIIVLESIADSTKNH